MSSAEPSGLQKDVPVLGRDMEAELPGEKLSMSSIHLAALGKRDTSVGAC